MKKTKDPTLVIDGACALIWTILTLMKVPRYMQDNSIILLILLILNAVCAVLWILAFVLRYRELQRNQQSKSTQTQEGEPR